MRTIPTPPAHRRMTWAFLSGCLSLGYISAAFWLSAVQAGESGKAVQTKRFSPKDLPTKRIAAAKKAMAERVAAKESSSPAKTAPAVESKKAASVSDRPMSTSRSGGPSVIAADVDRLIEEQLSASNVTQAGIVNDEDFLRRVYFDIAGTIPTAKEVTLFGLNPDRDKRTKIVDQLLATDDYAWNWARYWRDVLFLRATNERAGVMTRTFEDWMVKQLQENAGWNQITHDLLTGLGDISERGETALIFMHEANPEEIAGEVSRIFLGIQMQCANCHDHPTDKWTRDQFHSLAAFFPRITLQREPNNPRGFTVVSFDGRGPGRFGAGPFQESPERTFAFIDRNQDGKLTKEEVGDSPISRLFERLLENADKNRDGALTLQEIKDMPPPPMPPGRGKSEHHMADLGHPNAEGKLMTPALFTTNVKGRVGMEDEDRRELLAKWITSPNNIWFAKSLVNRMWGELLGEGFYMPIDDMGPERKPRMAEALDVLAAEFVKHDHDLKWLLRTITATRAYQRQVRYNEPTENPVPFASAIPVRLRSDQLFNAVIKVLGMDEGPRRDFPGPGLRFGPRDPRGIAETLFGYDPSTPQEELLGNVPQALFLMNLPAIGNALRAEGNTRLGQILTSNKDDQDAIGELYLSFLARDPSEKELAISTQYLATVGIRREAFEDLAWSLLNSSEFLSKR